MAGDGPPIFSSERHGGAGDAGCADRALEAANAVLREAAAGAATGQRSEVPGQGKVGAVVGGVSPPVDSIRGQATPEGKVGARLVDLAVRMLLSRPSSVRRVSREHTQEITEDVFPLPLPRDHRVSNGDVFHSWEEGIIRSLNWLSCGSFEVSEEVPSRDQSVLLREIRHLGPLFEVWKDHDISALNPSKLFSQKLVNSYGEEVHVAQSLRWENVSESLPKAGVAGVVPAVDVCTGGFREYVLHPERWLKPKEAQVYLSPPRVMIPREEWGKVCKGLIDRGVCGLMPLSEAYCVEGQPVLGGIFGVPKHEKTSEGVDILRLIMDLRPINECFLNLGGDLSTLPVMSQMIQLQRAPPKL